MPEVSRLDSALGARRVELGMEWQEVAEKAGLSPQHLIEIRKEKRVPRALTKRKLEDALQLEAGTIDAFLSGRAHELKPSAPRPEFETLQGGIPSRPITVVPPAEAVKRAREWAMNDKVLTQQEREEIMAIIARAEVRHAAGLPPVPGDDEDDDLDKYKQHPVAESGNGPRRKVG